jgi:hypothetical protein
VLRTIAALVLAPVAAATLALGATHAAAADDPNAASFVAKANAARQAHGLAPYVVAADLAAVARRHSAEMAAKQSLYHNPNLGSEVTGWQVVGENVGDGGTVDSIQNAFMNSPAHRANILAKDYTQVGIGTVTDSRGVIWVTEVFRLPYRAPVVQAPVRRTAARSVTRPVARRRTVARPAAKPVVRGTRRVAVLPVPERADAASFALALAPPSSGLDPLARAVGYADSMAALVR